MLEISTSILSVKEEDAIKTFYNLEVAKTDYFHIDVMDGEFVEKNTTKTMQEYSNIIKQISNLPLDVHLMVKDIRKHIDEYIPLSPQVITFHLEATSNKEETMNLIKYLKENNIKVGISIKPSTNESEIFDYLKYLYLVLVMTVEPGKGGQKLIPETLEKAKRIKQYIKLNNLETFVEVDGGVNKETIELVQDSDVDIAVAGSAIINSNDFKTAIKELKQ